MATVLDAFMKAGESKTGLIVIQVPRLPFDELRVLSLMFHVAGETVLVFILVVSFARTHATGHLRVTSEAPLVVDLTVKGVTGRAIVWSGKLDVETAQGTGRLSRLEVLEFCSGKKGNTKNAD